MKHRLPIALSLPVLWLFVACHSDVLVAPLTRSPWEVLFPHIGALVTEGGGLLSHPAILAREYGLPAVLGAGAATEKLRTGDRVTIDGAKGTVERADG